jgi:hypothetical protein
MISSELEAEVEAEGEGLTDEGPDEVRVDEDGVKSL